MTGRDLGLPLESGPPARRSGRLGGFGLRARVGVIAVLVAVPLVAASVLRLATDREAARAAAVDETGRLASLVADAALGQFDAARHTLVAIASTPLVRGLDPAACTSYLRDLLPAHPEYINLAATDAEGNVVCSGVPTIGPVSVADRPYFTRAIATGSIAIGEYSIGRVTRQPVIVVAMPIRNPTGAPSGIVLASVPLVELAQLGREVGLPAGAAVTIVDRGGTILVREPDPQDWVGQTLPGNPLIAAMLTGSDRTVEAAGVDGTVRLYALRSPEIEGASGIHIAVGFAIEQLTAAADRQFQVGMALLLTAVGVALALSWYGVRRLILRPVGDLTAAANRIASGDLEARTGLSGGGELGALAATFDRMAASVQERVETRTADLSAALAELRSSEAQLAEAERRTREYLDIAVDPLTVSRAIRDPETHEIVDFEAIFSNAPAGEIIGPAYAAIGARLSATAPDLYQRRIAVWSQVVASGVPVEYDAEIPHAGTGELRDLAVRITRVGDGVAVAFRDVTSTKRLQRALESARAEAERARQAAESARAEAERANASKTAFLSRMSHELRTPLNAVIGFGQLLDLEPLPNGQRESVHHILRGGRHLLDLINEVLDISRIESGTLTISPEPVHVAAAVTEAVALITPLAEDRGVRLAVEDGERHVLADRQRLKQVLLNLLSNAVKFNRPGGPVIVAITDVAADRVRIGVRDEGAGIPPAMRDRVFAPFDRLEAEATGVEGTGLGLALSKVLVERMGGVIGFDSIPGEGSTFWFELPVATPDAVHLEDAGPVEERRASATGPSPAGPRPGGTVLCIEDNLPNLQLIERLLAPRVNVRVIPAMLGGLGIELAREHRPDLILLDMHLPDLDGSEVLGRLRADPNTREIPVVILSADATPAQEERLVARGAVAYVAKPFDVIEFLDLIERLLTQRDPSAGDPSSPDRTG